MAHLTTVSPCKKIVGAGLVAISFIAASAAISLPQKLPDNAKHPVRAEQQNPRWRDNLIEQLLHGDIVFRRGVGDISDAISATQGAVRGQRTTWTHVGIVTQIRPGGDLYIAHAVDSGVLLDSPRTFFSDQEASAGTRIKGTKTSEAAATKAQQYLGRPFDNGFSLANENELYCTQLLIMAFRDAGAPLKMPLRQLPLLLEPVAMPDDLFKALDDHYSKDL